MKNWPKIILVSTLILILVLAVNFLFFYNLKENYVQPTLIPTYRNVNNGGDQMVYFSMIRQSAEGKNFLLNLFTDEEQIGLISPLWWFIGKVVAISGLSIPITYYLFTMASAFCLLVLVFYLTKEMFAFLWQRLLALVLMVFGGGLGIFYVNRLLFPAGGKALTEEDLFSKIISADLWYGEGFGFLSLRHSPLFILTQLILVLLFWWIAEKIKTTNWWQVMLLAVVVFFLTLVHPYDAVPLAGFIVVYGLIFWRDRKFLDNWFKMIPLGLATGLAVLYFYYLKTIDPSFLGWAEQNLTRTPYPFSYLAGYFWLVIPAVYGSVLAFRFKQKRWQWLVIWLVVAAFLIFIPSPTQRRFASGIYIPMALLAWHGWLYFWQKKNKIIFFCVTTAYFILASTTFFLIISLNINVINNNLQMTKITKDELVGLEYYKNISNESDILLTFYNFGNLVPAYISRKVYIGHGHQTVNWPDKKQFTDWFYKDNGQEDIKYEEIKKRNINYVWIDSSKDNYLLRELSNTKYFSLVYSNDKIKIYKVIY